MRTKRKIARRIAETVIVLWAGAQPLAGQQLPSETRERIGDLLTETARTEIRCGRIGIDSVGGDRRTLELYADKTCSYIPFPEENVKAIYDGVRALLPEALHSRRLVLYADGSRIEDMIPRPLRSRTDRRERTFTAPSDRPLVVRADAPYRPEAGLADRHIALWQSHGYYFEPKLNRWEWQRARIFQTVEDLYTQSYVLPYLVPMLENAGACVLLPRERDTQTHEVIVDNDPGVDASSHYTETGAWSTGDGEGFAHVRTEYRDTDNPFRDGSFRQVRTTTRPADTVSAVWTPDIPETGRYAVYVSYKTVENSADDALYTVRHRGGETRFRVNQTMGGGTWIYLGRFLFDAGCSPAGCVTLSNLSRKGGRIVTADGVKFGGGTGNVARIVPEAQRHPQIAYRYETSGYPRFTEGARYWLQWAGFADSVYTVTGNENDYRDDYMCRGIWVNALAGGSKNAPHRDGLRIPVDMSFAFHSDAGTTPGDSIIGTLGIYYSRADGGRFPNGVSREASRDLTDLVQSQIVSDIRAAFEPEWSRRGMWNASYFEARVPEVPAMLLELLSHQNFADMRYGLDPRFRFTVSRAIYKGILRYLSHQYRQPFVVQPLPVDRFRAEFTPEGRVALAWEPVTDTLEATAVPDRYVLYTRIGDGDFDNGVVVEGTSAVCDAVPGRIYSYRVTALNRGGESFPSEVLSVCRTPGSRGTVLVVNGFDRVSAPQDFVCDSLAGFCDAVDHGVPYLEDISYIGSQYEFCRSTPYGDDDAAGFGASRADYETQVVAGNTFDYPARHGEAIVAAGYSFVSCSAAAVADGSVRLDRYRIVDLVLGKQRRTTVARGAMPARYEAFPPALRCRIADYLAAGGGLFVSGTYVGSDPCGGPDAEAGRAFTADVLKFRLRTGRAAVRGAVRGVASPFGSLTGRYEYFHGLNAECYAVESPDAIEPACEDAFTVFRYGENNLSAGVAYRDDERRICTLGFPFEAVRTPEQRRELMRGVLEFLETR